MTALVQFLVTRRFALLSLSLFCCVVFALAIPRTEFDTSIGVLLTQSDPYLQERDEMVQVFPSPVEISFALLPKSGQVFETRTLLALADLNREFRQIPLALSMDSVLDWQSPFGDESLFTRVLTAQSVLSDEQLQQAKQRVMADPFLVGQLIAPEADLALANVRLRSTGLTREQSSEIVQASDDLLASLQARHPEVNFYLSSTAHYEQSNREGMISDLSLLLPIVLLLCTGFICYSFRSVYLGFCILGVALLTVLMTVGTLAWLGTSFNSISVMAPLVVVTIAVADSVHIISLYRQALLRGLQPLAAMSQSVERNFRPISLATVTTIIGFASLNFASAPAVSSFGSVVALGVAFAYVLTLTVLPGAILLFPARVDSGTGSCARVSIIDKVLKGCRHLVFAHGPMMLAVVSVLACIALGLSLRNTTDFDRASFISKDSPLYDYYSQVNPRMGQGTQLSYGVKVNNAYGVIEPAFLQRLDTFSQWLSEQEGVVGVASLVDAVKTVNQIMHEEQGEDAFIIPNDPEAIDEALFNYSVAQASNFTLATLVNDNYSIVRLFVGTQTQSNQSIIALNTLVDEKFAQDFPDAQLLHGSSTLLFARMDKAVTVELLQGYVLSLLMITVTLMLGMRSAALGLLSVLPNLLPAVFVFGAWGLFVGELDPFVMMLFSISIGLVVDDTVHVLSAYQSAVSAGLAPRAAIEQALAKAGPALIITTSVMALGTCVLIAASTLYFQQAATLLVPIVILALVLDITYFPALLARFGQVLWRPNVAIEATGKGR